MDIITYYILNYFFLRKKDGKEFEKKKRSFNTKEEGMESFKALKGNPYARVLSYYRIVETRESLTEDCKIKPAVV